MQSCSLLSLATAVPPHVITQSEAKARAREAFGGKKALFGYFVGRTMKAMQGKANPQVVNEVLKAKLG